MEYWRHAVTDHLNLALLPSCLITRLILDRVDQLINANLSHVHFPKHLHHLVEIPINEVEGLISGLIKQLALHDLVIHTAQKLELGRNRIPHNNSSYHLGSIA